MRKIILCLVLIVISAVVFASNNIAGLEIKLQNSIGPAKIDILISLSKAYWYVSPYKGINYAKKAIEIATIFGYKKKHAKALLYGGVNYWALGSYDEALKYYHKSLKISEEIHDIKSTAFILNNIGMVQQKLKDHKNALSNYLKASEIMKEIGDELEYAKIINNIGELNIILGRYNKALDYYLSILYIVKKTKERRLLLWVLSNIGVTQYKLKKYSKALDYYFQALKISEIIDDNLGKAMILNHIANTQIKLKKYNDGLAYYMKGLKIAKEAGAKNLIMNNYKNISEYYSIIGNYRSSLKYNRLFKEMSDRIFDTKKTQKIIEMQTRYETEKKDKEIQILKKNKIIEKSNRNIMIALIFITLIIIVVLVYLYLNKINMNKKLNRISKIDYLTQLSNRRDMSEKNNMERIRFDRHKKPFVFIICDIDKFKNINDTYGHDTGDMTLVVISDKLREAIREQDNICRWGGEEFLLLLPETDLEGGRVLAEKMRKSIAELSFGQKNKTFNLTMTFGVCEYNGTMNIEGCIKKADNALFEGKKKGRNQVILAGNK